MHPDQAADTDPEATAAAEGTVVPAPAGDGTLRSGDLTSIGSYVAAAQAESTRRTYARDVAAWAAWCAGRALPATLPADPLAVAAWLASMADDGHSPRYVARRLSALNDAHRTAGHPAPGDSAGVRRTLAGIRRTAARAGHRPRRARAVDTATVRALVEDLPETLAGTRDRCLILIGYALGLRASDLCWLRIEDLTPAGHGGLDVLVRFSKTDQDGAGETLALAEGVREVTCPVRAARAWLAALAGQGITSGPLFRSVGKGRAPRLGTAALTTRSVDLVLTRAAERAGVSPEGLSPHSLRRGFATTAYAQGVSEKEISRTGRWRSLVVRSYDASGRWADPASGSLGL
ncbi:site-specific integrase [Geodermatophilus sabuli]|uniref:Site-specific recombinase XerD n=1 Tax=Geodermatophilus sabuli TaxID=1564158 RepID=A0A285EHL4_9ACTN|nr:site-specific integrase [Geodermatophilus sabuli]MBB3083970.1 integrase [Geodermatophilus sabuli]SNX98618.1 Site-specific recombinase XerD [Geodermatophilus sabuli]